MNEALNSKVGEIERLQQQVHDLRTQGNDKTGYWLKLDKINQSLSADQQEFLNNSVEVLQAKTQLVEAFNLFLFRNFREQFAQDDCFKIICDRYIDTIQDELKQYGNNISKIIEENKKLKNEISQIKEKYYVED